MFILFHSLQNNSLNLATFQLMLW